jgi:hypothetical protein
VISIVGARLEPMALYESAALLGRGRVLFYTDVRLKRRTLRYSSEVDRLA